MFLNDAEIKELTGYTQTAAQIKWLRQNGLIFRIGGDNKPKIAKSHIDQIFGNVAKSRKKSEPKFGDCHG